MRIRTGISILLAFVFLIARGQDEPRVSCDFQQAAFDEFVRVMEAESGVTFYYNKDWVGKLVEVTRGVGPLAMHTAHRKTHVARRASHSVNFLGHPQGR